MRREIAESTVCKLVAQVVPRQIAENGIAPEMSLREQLDIDSVALLSLLFLLEQHFALDLASSIDKFAEAVSVADVVAIARAAGAAAA